MGVTDVGRGVVLAVRVGEKEERGYKCAKCVFQGKRALNKSVVS